MRTITLEEFRADPVKAWEMAEDGSGDIIVLGKDGKRRAVLHAIIDRSDDYWDKAEALNIELANMLNNAEVSADGMIVMSSNDYTEIMLKRAELWKLVLKYKTEKEKW